MPDFLLGVLPGLMAKYIGSVPLLQFAIELEAVDKRIEKINPRDDASVLDGYFDLKTDIAKLEGRLKVRIVNVCAHVDRLLRGRIGVDPGSVDGFLALDGLPQVRSQDVTFDRLARASTPGR